MVNTSLSHQFEKRLNPGLQRAFVGEAVIAFVRSMEDCPVPLTLVPVRMIAGTHGCELDLTLVFYDYVSLANREPALYGVIAPLKGRPGHQDKVDLYMQGVGVRSKEPFSLPGWTRDPFALTAE